MDQLRLRFIQFSFLPRHRSSLIYVVVGILIAFIVFNGYAAERNSAAVVSGFDQMSAAVQALQRDDAQNPAMLWVKGGEKLWQSDCANCHGEAQRSMNGVALTYPKFSSALNKPITLSQQINACRTDKLQLTPLATESEPLLQLTSYVALQSRGMPIQVSPALSDSRNQPFLQNGERYFKQRMGQLDLSCAHCHDERAGLKLGGAVIPQGHSNAYPIYRLEWQGVGSLQRRLRNCMVGVKAIPFADQAIEWTELELYLRSRSVGLTFEAPGVRP